MNSWFESLHLCIALAPLAIYFLVIGYLNLRPRTTVVSGFADTLLLGFAVSGIVMVGPFELFFPEMAAFRMGPWVWLLLIVLYVLFIVLLGLSQRPRVVFFNAKLDQVHDLVGRAAREVDQSTERLSNCLVLPASELQLHVSSSPLFRTVQLESLGEEHNLVAWNRVRRKLAALGRESQSVPAAAGYALIALAALCLAILGTLSVTDQQEIAKAFGELLRRE